MAAVTPSRRSLFDHRREARSIRALQRWTSSAALDAALALSFSRAGQNDPRPDVVAWYFGSVAGAEGIAHLLPALARAARDAARAVGFEPTGDAVNAAVMDAVARVRGRRPLAAAKRAAQLRMRTARFSECRRAAEAALLKAIRNGFVRYLNALG